MPAVLEVKNLRAGYSGREILKGVSFTVNADDFFAIIGPSGSGKSTLIRCVNRLVEPDSGEVLFNGTDILQLDQTALRHTRRNIGMIFQEFNLIERLSVIDNVLTGRLGYTGTLRSLFRVFTKDDIKQALMLLDRVGLGEHVDKRADRLSGGQRQRVGIARALIQNPRLLLVDEPTSSLDPKISREVMGLIREMAREFHVPVLCNIHDVELATEFCTRVIGLQDGRQKIRRQSGQTRQARAAGNLCDGGALNDTSLDVRVAAMAAVRGRARAQRYTGYFAIFAVVVWSIYAIVIADTDWSRILNGRLMATLGRFMELDYKLIPDLLAPTIETIVMATLATLAGLVLSIPVAWLGASNITPVGKSSYVVGRFLMTMSRSVHEIVWALIFVSAVGLGALAGVLAMAVRSVGFISKTIAEAIEDVDPKPIEAVRAAGGNRFQILIFAILPQIVPVFLGNMIFEWDINIRRSTIMGLVGAGGLGLALFRQMAMFNYGGIATVVVAVLCLILFGEVVSYYARKAVI